jgi:hypothetical protein
MSAQQHLTELEITDAPIPSINPRYVHLQRPHPAARIRERLSVAIRLGLCGKTSTAQRTVILQQRPTLALGRIRGSKASVVCVERDLVVRLEVDALDDVDLAAIGP